MTIAELIRGRRSVALFKDKPLPEGLVEELLEIAVWAPNHGMTQPWRFILLTGDSRLAWAEAKCRCFQEAQTEANPELMKANREKTFQKFLGIPALLVAVVSEHEHPVVREENYAACACVIQNFLLLAWERGIGTSWKSFQDAPHNRECLGIADDEKVVGIVYIGFPSNVPEPRSRASVRDRITYLR